MRWLLLLYPWLELLSLIQLGVETNAFVALGWVMLTLAGGVALLRRAGSAGVAQLRDAQNNGVLRQQVLLDDMASVVAALMLMIPGLLSDVIGIVILIGPVRRGVARLLSSGGEPEDIHRHDAGSTHPDSQASTRRPVTLEGDYSRVDDRDDS